jgi:hypothetical protein
VNIDTPTERKVRKRCTEQPTSTVSKNFLEVKQRNAKTMASNRQSSGSRGRVRRCLSDIVSSNFSNSSPGVSNGGPISQDEVLTMRLFGKWIVSEAEIKQKMEFLSGKLNLGSACGNLSLVNAEINS